MKRTSPQGILGFPVTPMDAEGNIDLEALGENIEFLIKEGLSAIFVACGAGEFHAISTEEYRAIVKVGVEKTNGKVPLYTGVGGNIKHAVEQAEISAELGAEGYLILPPYLIDPSQDGLNHYLSTIIRSTSLNAIVYQRDNCVMDLETLRKLCEYEQLVGFKDGIGNMEQVIEFANAIGDRLEWINGMPLAEVTMPAYLNIGYKTYSSAISNYIPHISAQFFEALLNGNMEKVYALHKDVILPIHRIRRQKKGYAVSLIKAGMRIVGLPVETNVRAPIAPVEPNHYESLEGIIETAFKKYPVKTTVN
ncbi:5-dehydro-4-deoxyglucarate dehydratase [Oceanobacillus arenosus]